ncbi:MAG: polysaccharide deacetylase family protein [Anaerolineae bacterium]
MLDWLKRDHPLPPKSIVLTFDDAYASIYTTAWPLMAAHGFTGTLFIITGAIGRTNHWQGQPSTIPERPLMSWAQVQELAAAGWEMGAHTVTHPALPLLPVAEMEREILDSQTAVRKQLTINNQQSTINSQQPTINSQQSTTLFAQPYGATSPAVDDVVHRHFDGAVSVKLGLVSRKSDPYALPRVDAYYLHPRLIPHLGRPSFRRYLQLRQLLRHARRLVKRDYT